MSKTFEKIKELVVRGQLSNSTGFSGKEVLKNTDSIKKSTINTFLWKHSENCGKIPNLYFEKVSRGKYRIRAEFYDVKTEQK
jgi:hypothetical protein